MKPKIYLTPSIELVPFIKSWESLHDGDLSMVGIQPKPDARGIWTEGYGHAMVRPDGKFYTTKNCSFEKAIRLSQVKTEQEALALLKWDLSNTANGVLRNLKIDLPQHKFDAMVSHRFNCGHSETLYKRVNGKYPEKDIKEWFTKHYITAGGVELLGLKRRRVDEYEMWLKADYKRDNKITI